MIVAPVKAEMIVIYQNADQAERNTVIKQIDSFLKIVPKYAKTFWLKFRCNLERLSEMNPSNN